MCLKKLHVFPKIAWKPIKVYKALVPIDSANKFHTPFIGQTVSLGETIKSSSFFLKGIFTKYLEGEVVHAYLNFNEAQYRSRPGVVIVEATIPRFSFYWKGTVDDIGATRLKI